MMCYYLSVQFQGQRVNYIRALNLGSDDKTADEILIAWPAACRIRYSVLGYRGASGKSVGSIAVFFINKLHQTHAGFLIVQSFLQKILKDFLPVSSPKRK